MQLQYVCEGGSRLAWTLFVVVVVFVLHKEYTYHTHQTFTPFQDICALYTNTFFPLLWEVTNASSVKRFILTM
jgi:hypothetical protein